MQEGIYPVLPQGQESDLYTKLHQPPTLVYYVSIMSCRVIDPASLVAYHQITLYNGGAEYSLGSPLSYPLEALLVYLLTGRS